MEQTQEQRIDDFLKNRKRRKEARSLESESHTVAELLNFLKGQKVLGENTVEDGGDSIVFNGSSYAKELYFGTLYERCMWKDENGNKYPCNRTTVSFYENAEKRKRASFTFFSTRI